MSLFGSFPKTQNLMKFRTTKFTGGKFWCCFDTVQIGLTLKHKHCVISIEILYEEKYL